MTYVNDNSLGGKLKPIHNNIELTKAMKSRRNCCLYTVGTFPINEENLYTLKISNIKLIGLAFARLKFKPKKNNQDGLITTNIVFDEMISLNINVNTNISEEKNKYLSGGMH